MLRIPEEAVIELPVDQLGLAVLKDMVASETWNARNYILEAQQDRNYRGEASRALAEAIGWLYARGLITADPNQSSGDAIFVTRTGKRIVAEGPEAFYATERLQRGLHAMIEKKARPQFLIGEYEQGVFAAMKAVEVRVRKLARLGDEDYGVPLMNKAFGPKGPLTDPAVQKAEQEGTRSMFAGAYGVLRNPPGHREVSTTTTWPKPLKPCR